MDKEYLALFLTKTRFPQEAKNELMRCAELVSKYRCEEQLDGLTEFFFENDFSIPLSTPQIDELAKSIDISPYTVWLLFLILSSQPIREAFEQKEIPEKVFWHTFEDLRYKASECHEVQGVWGNFVAFWYPIFFTCDLLKLGRLEYENGVYEREEPYQKNGILLQKGDPVKSIHIPASGEPFDEATRLLSYRMAYDFFREERNGAPLICVCDSWLLHPSTTQILKPASNIVSFAGDFDLLSHRDEEEFRDAWRVFGKDYQLPTAQLPERTSMQRAFKKHLLSGGKTGEGYGVLVFDGNRIINR